MTAETTLTDTELQAPPRTCFVVGPIGDKNAALDSPETLVYERSIAVYEKVIRAACHRFGINPVRADEIAMAGEITEQICRHVLEDDIVIADIGDGNANVMYELGLRHATGKLTIQLGEPGPLPFDILSIRTIRYTRSNGGLIEARKSLEEALQAGLENPFSPLLPARILFGLDPNPKTSFTEHDQEEDDTSGLLEDIAAAEEVLDTMVADLTEITALIESIGEISVASSSQLEQAERSGASMNARMAVLMQFAEEVNEPADKIVESVQHFAGRMKTFDSGMRAVMRIIELTPREKRNEEAKDLLEQVISLSEIALQNLTEVNQLDASTQELGRFSKHLRKPGKKISAALREFEASMACIHEWEQAARSLQ